MSAAKRASKSVPVTVHFRTPLTVSYSNFANNLFGFLLRQFGTYFCLIKHQ